MHTKSRGAKGLHLLLRALLWMEKGYMNHREARPSTPLKSTSANLGHEAKGRTVGHYWTSTGYLTQLQSFTYWLDAHFITIDDGIRWWPSYEAVVWVFVCHRLWSNSSYTCNRHVKGFYLSEKRPWLTSKLRYVANKENVFFFFFTCFKIWTLSTHNLTKVSSKLAHISLESSYSFCNIHLH